MDQALETLKTRLDLNSHSLGDLTTSVRGATGAVATLLPTAPSTGTGTGTGTGLPTGFVSRTTPTGAASAPGNLAWNGNQFVGLEQSTDYHSASAKFFAWTSPDGIAWSRTTTNMPSNYVSLSAANGKFFQMSTSVPQTDLNIYSSTDGVTWSSGTATYAIASAVPSPVSVKYVNNRYFATMDVDTCAAISSTDGVTWTSTKLNALALPTNYYKNVNDKYCSEPFYIGGKYRIYGGVIQQFSTTDPNPPALGLVYSSTDGATWTADTFELPAGANTIEQGGRVSLVVQIGDKIVLPAVKSNISRRINPTDPYPTQVTDSAQVGTSSDGVTFTYADASGLTYPASAVGKPGLSDYFTKLEVSGLGMLGYNFSDKTNYWTADGVAYTATQDFGLRSPDNSYSSNYAYSPSLKRLVVVQWKNTTPGTPTVMTRDFQ
jgi:hypothetical protein